MARFYQIPLNWWKKYTGSTLPSSSNSDNIGCNENILQEFSSEELKYLDSEGRCVITQHQIQTEGDKGQ